MHDEAIVFLQDVLEGARDTDLAAGGGFVGCRRQGDALILAFETNVEYELQLSRRWDRSMEVELNKAVFFLNEETGSPVK